MHKKKSGYFWSKIIPMSIHIKSKREKIIGLLLLFVVVLFLLVPTVVSAGSHEFLGPIVPCGRSDQAKDEANKSCNFGHVIIGIQNLINYGVVISVPLAAVAFTFAGFLYVTAAGDTAKIASAHKIFKNVLIGFIIVLSAWLIVFTLTSALLRSNFPLSKYLGT